MKTRFYRQRQGRLLGGILAGIADSFHLDVVLIRILWLLFALFSHHVFLCSFLYALLWVIIPLKKDETTYHTTGPRKRKDAEPIDDDEDRFW